MIITYHWKLLLCSEVVWGGDGLLLCHYAFWLEGLSSLLLPARLPCEPAANLHTKQVSQQMRFEMTDWPSDLMLQAKVKMNQWSVWGCRLASVCVSVCAYRQCHHVVVSLRMETFAGLKVFLAFSQFSCEQQKTSYKIMAFAFLHYLDCTHDLSP